ncbi:carboxyvinyl-carboxyphosphonate phosphorylmutase [Mycobacterium haemophilum DSM 44634]|uniref:isocitrate lyase/PEP mutase family protein n=1 Tax=Mycobacterium haemophilum TaxID=29311 RepID=UPI0006561186|nr:isocitrate lyase/PEP mutase family protein [Mycobacterium haemophilum]AKN17015.1 carboxyvinyl-carboxyphosphonate phosphorylmutase [Mycobacterium haemophilum DSM 44634]MCV7340442.1 isocitrate lyase/PEP mutase family protein [Mycobacterium haemophilum DSM 44634]
MTSLKSLLACEDLLVAPGAHDGLAARIFQRAGFRAVYMTGNGVSASLLAAPDVGLLTMTEMTAHARAMVRAVQVPVIADADTGYGNRDNVARTVREYEASGVAAIHLEDQVFPKRCGAMGGIELISAEDHAAKIRAATAARSSAEFLIIGRTDSRLNSGFDEALRRARCYADAGADLILIEMLQTPKEIETAVQVIDVPIMFNAVASKTPELTPRQFADLGVKVLVYPLAATLVYAATMQNFAHHLVEGNTPATFQSAALDLTEYSQVLDTP